MRFCQYMVQGGLYDEVELRFVCAGHAKCSCDSNFGHFKCRLAGHVEWLSTYAKMPCTGLICNPLQEIGSKHQL
eukprot:m.269305 g.269305  ORF g.269305 m.269305 type:complete len:74 (+) comp15670_c0_seq8:1407-1628(+)